MTRLPARFNLNIGVGSRGAVGPLSVEVYSQEGETVADFALSSSRSKHTIKAEAGHYTVIARRPNGEKLRKSVTIDKRGTTVFLDREIGGSPNEFLGSETLRGEVMRLSEDMTTRAGKNFPGYVGALGGPASMALKEAIELGRKGPARARPPRDAEERLVVWGNAASVTAVPFSAPASFFKVSIAQPPKVKAIGLLDRKGVGPIVIVPPFREGIDISFIGECLQARAASRDANPSAMRAPVAVILPQQSATADLLSVLASPALDHADSYWEDSIHHLARMPKDIPIGMLLEKFQYPGEALLAAHYLLRFMPEELPLLWADNLGRALRDAADGPVIAAWARLSAGEGRVPDRDPKTCDREFQERIELALARPRVLFARTRRLLNDGLRLLPSLRSVTPRPAPADFLDYGAHAGGLEAFWGSSPTRPGLEPRKPEPDGGREIAKVVRQADLFTRLEPRVPAAI
jgi:hypothetical protein